MVTIQTEPATVYSLEVLLPPQLKASSVKDLTVLISSGSSNTVGNVFVLLRFDGAVGVKSCTKKWNSTHEESSECNR